ncbi:MAG: serine/threonine-protein kinase [Thermoanaerobaculia bacterium]
MGPYEVIGPLGAGGMGEVFRARDPRLSREVAIKVLPEALSSDRDRLRRFEKEARSASALNHPNIVTIHEVGSVDSGSYIVMELVAGVTLRELIAEAPLPARRLLNVSAQIAEGLAKAHGSGIVHRDLKPENVMITGDGHVKILDFGLAKLTEPNPTRGDETRSPTVSAGTEPGVVMGTAGYMSPEQASGKIVDFRSDQFSLGSMLYEMATGKHAFARETKPETLTAIIRDDPEPIALLNPRLPAPLRWVIERCLAKEPKERYASTEDLARDLAHIRDHLSEASVVSSPETAARPARRPWLLGAAALAAAAVLGLLAGRFAGKPASLAPTFQRVTFRRGLVSNARFAADGQTVVYGAK